MSKKTIGLILIIVGAVVFVGALLGGILGIPHPGFGYLKIAVAVVGAILVAAGILLSIGPKKAKAEEAPKPPETPPPATPQPPESK